MYLTNNGANFNWTPYQIGNNSTPVSAYYIYRDDNSTGNFHSIGNTTGNQLGFTDVNYSSYPNAIYYVEAVMTTGACHPTRSGFNGSISNLNHIGTTGVQQLNNHSQINIYPNPATNTLHITGIAGKIIIRLYDCFGKLVYENSSPLLVGRAGDEVLINTSQLAEGFYTLSTSGKFGETFNKVMISR
jgi:hypothetical protein